VLRGGPSRRGQVLGEGEAGAGVDEVGEDEGARFRVEARGRLGDGGGDARAERRVDGAWPSGGKAVAAPEDRRARRRFGRSADGQRRAMGASSFRGQVRGLSCSNLRRVTSDVPADF